MTPWKLLVSGTVVMETPPHDDRRTLRTSRITADK
jgi:hypothetical protein